MKKEYDLSKMKRGKNPYVKQLKKQLAMGNGCIKSITIAKTLTLVYFFTQLWIFDFTIR